MSDPAFEAITKARNQASSGNPTGAANTLEAYLATDPHNTKPRLVLAEIAIRDLQDTSYGLMQLDVILDLDPDNTDAMKAKVSVLARDKRNNKETDGLFRRLADPSNYVYHQNYAVLLLNDLKDYRKAKEELELLMEIKPADPKIRSNYDKLMRTKFDKDGNLKRSWKDKLRHRCPAYRGIRNAHLCLRSS